MAKDGPEPYGTPRGCPWRPVTAGEPAEWKNRSLVSAARWTSTKPWPEAAGYYSVIIDQTPGVTQFEVEGPDGSRAALWRIETPLGPVWAQRQAIDRATAASVAQSVLSSQLKEA